MPMSEPVGPNPLNQQPMGASAPVLPSSASSNPHQQLAAGDITSDVLPVKSEAPAAELSMVTEEGSLLSADSSQALPASGSHSSKATASGVKAEVPK